MIQNEGKEDDTKAAHKRATFWWEKEKWKENDVSAKEVCKEVEKEYRTSTNVQTIQQCDKDLLPGKSSLKCKISPVPNVVFKTVGLTLKVV